VIRPVRKRIPAPLAWLIVIATVLAVPPPADAAEPGSAPGPSLGGMSGLINTPVADVLPDGVFRLGYGFYDKKEAYDSPNVHADEVVYFAIGFVPRLEVMIRATFFPGETFVAGANIPDVDRMASARILLFREGKGPAIAAGIDDPRGTRRYHSLYLVAGKSFMRQDGKGILLNAGYGSSAIRARRHILHGGFGGVEFRAERWISGIAEYDSEKWNLGGRLSLQGKVTGEVVLLGAKTLSWGVAWTHSF